VAPAPPVALQAGQRMKRKDYERRLEPLQLELNNLAHWLRDTGRRVAVLFEGRDAAGKGRCINAIAETLNPRQVRIVALGPPSERERAQWYFQRYVAHLAAAGELVLFDRSWYNRAGVEKVMGYCGDAEYRRFFRQVPRFESASRMRIELPMAA
jgi:polyphosphate kinase 2 (PPK2 family)